MLTLAFNRFHNHSLPVVRRVTVATDLLTFVASLATLVILIVLAGFDNDTDSSKILIKSIRYINLWFVVNILFNYIFNFKSIFKEKRRFRLFLDILLLLTLLPAIYPHPAHPWFPWLEKIIYSNYFSGTIITVYAVVYFCSYIVSILGRRVNPSVIMGVSFMFFIILGSFLLMMPKCTVSGISYIDSLFISTSAVSITGLCPIDISTTFTPLGLLILAILIQIGGLGILTFTSLFALFFTGNTSVYSQIMVRDMVFTRTMSSLLPTLLYIMVFTLVIEIIGAVAIFLSVHDTLGMGVRDELIFSAFHSLTAFMNAGFSNIEGGLSNPMLIHSNQSIYIIASILILAGGIGFPILVNFKTIIGSYLRRLTNHITGIMKYHYPTHIYDINTKIVLWSTLIIVIVSSGLFLLFEYNNSLRGMTTYEKIVQSVFNSFVPRSSGFSSVSPTSFTNVTIIMMVVLMWIGGASQSTAGGIKVNTFAAILINLKSIITGHKDVTVFRRRIAVESVRRANAVVTLSIISFAVYAMIIVGLEPGLPVKDLLYETASALFTVGSSLGITGDLSDASKIILCTAMFLGRVGLLSLLMGFAYKLKSGQVTYPTGSIIIN